MIFISYRREDTKAEVTNLHRRLAERFGGEQVFVDYNDIPPGKDWPDVLRQKLEESRVLLAVIGPQWGSTRFTTGKNMGRPRLDDPTDWVRQEICTAVRRGNGILVIVVPIDEAVLPETEWNCELDQLPRLQQARLRNRGDFESDFAMLCGWLERQVPELQRAAGSARAAPMAQPAPAETEDQVLRRYIDTELRSHTSIQLPIISQSGQPVIAPIEELWIDLPLIITHEHAPSSPETALLWIGHDVHLLHELLRSTHTNALLVDRASRFEDTRRDCDISSRLAPGSRLVVVGDPGCGKSTLLQWIAHSYGSLFRLGAKQATAPTRSLPNQDWLPVLILCRDLVGQPLPTRIEELLSTHLKQRQFSDAAIAILTPCFERLLEQGKAILLVDGLDEIPDSEQRREFCRLLTSIANRFPDAAIVITSRVVGFQAVRDELASKYDHLLVSPLDRAAKQAYIELWSSFIGWDAARAADLIRQVCHNRIMAKLTENVFLLAMVAQIQVLDHKLPGRRVDIYRRAVQLMIQRRRPFLRPLLSLNELIPHLEYLAYGMRKKGVQRCSEEDAVDAFRELRRLEPGEPVLETRPPGELLRACIDSVGILNLAGTETDRRGFERYVIQFFHQSFQEYFAGQAINHGHDGAGQEGPVARLRDLLATIEIREREVNIWGRYKIVEPVIADYWQEAVRLGIADLNSDAADDAILMLLPSPMTPPHEARPRAVFALQCLADEPHVSEQTVSVVFDAMLDNLREDDGLNTKLNTWMDEALAAVSESAFSNSLRDRLLDAFINSSEERRDRAGCCFFLRSSEEPIVTVENADALIAAARQELSSDRQVKRVRSALELMNRFFVTEGKLGFLTPSQRSALLESLVSALPKDEATACAVIWALGWLTGAKYRLGNMWSENSMPPFTTEFVLLDGGIVRTIENFLKDPYLDINTLSWGCLVLTREKDLNLVALQINWIYELALIADGVKPRRILPEPQPAGRLASVEWMRNRLSPNFSLNYSARIAAALGSFGIFASEMILPLQFIFTNGKHTHDQRDEALIYLSLIGEPEIVPILVAAADTPPTQEDDYFYHRGLLGLLLLDNIDVLAEQMRKDLNHSDLNAYAYGLAGSRDPRGLVLLEEMKNHSNGRIRNAVKKALSCPWMSAE